MSKYRIVRQDDRYYIEKQAELNLLFFKIRYWSPLGTLIGPQLAIIKYYASTEEAEKQIKEMRLAEDRENAPKVVVGEY